MVMYDTVPFSDQGGGKPRPYIQYTGFAGCTAKPVQFLMAHRCYLVHLGLG